MDLPTEIAIATLAVALGGLIIALVRTWLHVKTLEAEKRRFDQFIVEMRRLADTGSISVHLQSQANTEILQQRARAVGLQEQAFQHQRLMDYAKLVIGVWDRLKDSENENEDEYEDDDQ